MLYSVTGNLIAKTQNMAAISCNGIAFHCNISAMTALLLPEIGADATLYTFLSVKQDGVELYGFADNAEQECFRLLTGVSGVGPKAALAVLSEMDPDTLVLCIASGDSKSITKANGVGSKTAQRIVLELHDKMGSVPVSEAGRKRAQQASIATHAPTNVSDAVTVLVSLGYPQHEAASAVGQLDASLPADELIRGAIALLSGRG